MKTAISLPDSLFREAERFARRFKRSRSRLYADAIAEYLARHFPDEITESLNDMCSRMGEQDTVFADRPARKIIAEESW